MSGGYQRRVGTARPSHLMYTSGIGALIDLPHLSVLVCGIDAWDYRAVQWQPLAEERLLTAVRRALGPQVRELRPPPWAPEDGSALSGQAHRVGVPVSVFPQWLRCTRCNELAPLDAQSAVWQFDNRIPSRPDQARFTHASCTTRGWRPLAVAARFVLACPNGHLDEFPYREFVHQGRPCQAGARLRMEDRAGNIGPNVKISCLACGAERNLRQAMGARGAAELPACRGRHPHLGTFEPCDATPRALVVGASNQWFAQTLSTLAVPPTGASALQAEIVRAWPRLESVTSREVLAFAVGALPELRALAGYDLDEVMTAVEAHRKERETGAAAAAGTVTRREDLLAPEWEVFTCGHPPAPSEDFALARPGVPPELAGLFADVVQVERLREVQAFIGFTRLEAPDPADPESTVRAPIARDQPEWVPGSEVHGEGIFLRLREDVVAAFEERVAASEVARVHRAAYRRFRANRTPQGMTEVDLDRGWPGIRYYAVHTLAHLLIRRIGMECGYSSASLAERIYAAGAEAPDGPWAGILLYTAASDSEGTLGGLVALAEPATLSRLVRDALADAHWCSSDPLCAERLPRGVADDFLHGAACHVCLFVSETSCERGNRFLDRRFLVDLGDPSLVLAPGLA